MTNANDIASTKYQSFFDIPKWILDIQYSRDIPKYHIDIFNITENI